MLPPGSIGTITSEIDWSYGWQREGDVRFTRADAADAPSEADEEELWDEDDHGLHFSIETHEWEPLEPGTRLGRGAGSFEG